MDDKTPPPPRENDFHRVNTALNDAHVLAARCEMLAERLLGSYPKSGNVEKLQLEPIGALPRLGAAADSAIRRMGDAYDAISRIESALPDHVGKTTAEVLTNARR